MLESSPADEVRRTLHAYCRRLDERDLDALLEEVYLPDAVDDRQRGEPLRGHAAIRSYFERALSRLRATAHVLSNIDVSIEGPEGSQANASSRVTAYHWSIDSLEPNGPADFVLLGTYDDLLSRTPNGWRIQARRVGALGPSGLASGSLPAVFAGFGGRR
jgi:ketosteroid isomerase-like protein